MSNIYLKVTIETFSKLRFSGFRKLQISLNFKTCCNLKIIVLGSKLRGFSTILILKGIMTFFVKDSMHFVEQKYKL